MGGVQHDWACNTFYINFSQSGMCFPTKSGGDRRDQGLTQGGFFYGTNSNFL